MVYVKKNRKYSTRKGRRSYKHKMSFDKRVLSLVRKTREIKTKTFSFDAETIQNPVIGNNNYQILGPIRQGSGNDERVGTTINLLSVELKGIINYQQLTPLPVAAYVRLMILKQRNIANAQDMIADPSLFKTNHLLENDQPYVGSILDHITKINKDSFISKKQIKLKLMNTTNFQGNAEQTDNPLSSRFYGYTMRFGQGKKVLYDSNPDNESNNFPYFYLPVAAKQDGSPINLEIDTTFTFTIRYTDA